MTDLKKSETCIFTVKLNQVPLLRTKPLLFYHQEVKLSSRKSTTPRMKDYLSLWLDKTLSLKWKVLMKAMPKEVISFATISTIVKKLMNLKPPLTFFKFLKVKNSCHLDMNVSYICTLLQNKSKFSKWRLNGILKIKRTSLLPSWNQVKPEQ